ncbi:MAG: beta-galactosidase, partial [Mediterranea sp.]|nr:beta-galactosidase [Mediterranea sp.]
MKAVKYFIAMILTGFCLYSCQAPKTINLSGEWGFALDSKDEGIDKQWYNTSLSDKIHLPGSLQEQGYGFDVDVHTPWTGTIVDKAWYIAPEYAKYREKGNAKVPFWLNPDKHYVGVAWYQREIQIPGNWKGKSVWLELERTHWETTLFVDGNEVGHLHSLSTPHRYALKDLAPGKHTVTLRVDNRVHIPVGINAHSVSDHTQSNWNG